MSHNVRPVRSPSQRGHNSRTRILDAFRGLAQRQRFEQIALEDVAKAAGVGRATLYRHFGSKDGLMVASLEPLLVALADAGVGRASEHSIEGWMRHGWEVRWLLRSLLASPSRTALQRRLETLIAERTGVMEPAGALANLGIATAQLAMLHAWVSGEFSLASREIATAIVATSRLSDRFSSLTNFEVTERHKKAAAHHYALLGARSD